MKIEQGATNAQPSRLMTMAEFQREARIGRSAAYELARTGSIPVVRFGRTIRVPRTVLLPKAAIQE